MTAPPARAASDGARWTHRSALEREMAILEAVATSERLLSLSEIASAVDIPPSTAHRMIGVLCAQGLLRRSPWRTYAIGARLRGLALVIAEDSAN